jgi:hypothetical protein
MNVNRYPALFNAVITVAVSIKWRSGRLSAVDANDASGSR